MDLLHETALHWLSVKQIVAPDPAFRDALHVALGACLFLALRSWRRGIRFSGIWALSIVAALQGLNELFDAAGHGMHVDWPEALSDTALTLAPALIAALALGRLAGRRPLRR